MQTQDIVETWRQEAIQEGVKQGECAVLLRLLRQRFGDAMDAHVEQRVATASIEQIDLWIMRNLSATTLGELSPASTGLAAASWSRWAGASSAST